VLNDKSILLDVDGINCGLTDVSDALLSISFNIEVLNDKSILLDEDGMCGQTNLSDVLLSTSLNVELFIDKLSATGMYSEPESYSSSKLSYRLFSDSNFSLSQERLFSQLKPI